MNELLKYHEPVEELRGKDAYLIIDDDIPEMQPVMKSKKRRLKRKSRPCNNF